MGERGLGAVSRSEEERRTARRDRPQGAPPAAAGSDLGADQGGQDVRGPADCTTGAPVSKSRDGAPVEKSAAAVRRGRLAPLPADLAGTTLAGSRNTGRDAGNDCRAARGLEHSPRSSQRRFHAPAPLFILDPLPRLSEEAICFTASSLGPLPGRLRRLDCGLLETLRTRGHVFILRKSRRLIRRQAPRVSAAFLTSLGLTH